MGINEDGIRGGGGRDDKEGREDEITGKRGMRENKLGGYERLFEVRRVWVRERVRKG
jgi:hypothetical protein